MCRELGVTQVEVAGRSKVNVEELFWDTIAQVRADLAGIQRKKVLHFMQWTEQNVYGGSTLPFWYVMMSAWTDATWHGSATTL